MVRVTELPSWFNAALGAPRQELRSPTGASNKLLVGFLVRGQTPAACATASGVCPLSTCRTMRSRPRGESRAFLCTFIRSSRESLMPRNSSFLGQDRVDKLMKAHS
jgi:hypothetical protein